MGDDVTLADSLSTCQCQLKHYLYPRHFATVAQLCYCDTVSGPSSGTSYLIITSSSAIAERPHCGVG